MVVRSCSRVSACKDNVFSELSIQSKLADLSTLNPSAADGKCSAVSVGFFDKELL
jgi:hypothetical protein